MPPPSSASSFRRLVIRAAVLPVLLLLVLAAVLVGQIEQLLNSAAWVEHTDEIITNANRLLRLYIDMETGLRGYVITKDAVFLEPFDRGAKQIPPLTQVTLELLSDNPPQRELLAEINAGWTQWAAYAEREKEGRRTRDEIETVPAALTGKTMIDAIRFQFATFIGTEERLRASRGRDTERAAWRSVVLACVSVSGVGAFLGLLARRELRSLASSYEVALLLARQTSTDLERRVAERTTDLATSNESLVEANRELEAFGYSISHDLRAPLRHISGFADLLRRSAAPTLSADDTENLDTIADTARLAGRMVDDLLSFSRIGRSELRSEPVDMNALVDRVRRDLQPEFAGRDVAWAVGPLPPALGDANLIKLVLSNLIGNALKYTSKQQHASIEIAADAAATADVSAGDGDGATTYYVRDDGVGFDMAYAHKLFGVFQRLHRAEEYEGTGIGLANVRRIITRHGGRVWAEGSAGKGATFFFTLPGAAGDRPSTSTPVE